MKAHLTSLGKQTIVYGLSGALAQVVGVLTLPIFARTFSPAEYGVLELAMVGFAVLLLLADFGFASASQRSYFDYPEELPEARRKVLSTAIATSMAIALAASLPVVLARQQIAGSLFDDQSYAAVVAVVAVTVPLAILAIFMREIMRLKFRPWDYVISSALASVGAGVVSVVAVVWLDAGLVGFFIGLLTGNALALIYGVIAVRGELGFSFSVPELRTMLHFGIPLVPTAFALWGLVFIDRVLLAKFADLSAVGEYAVAVRFASVVMFVIGAFALAYSPFSYSLHLHDAEQEKEVRAKTLTYMTLALSTLALILTLFANEIASVVAPAFTSAYQVVGLLCLGAVVYGISVVLVMGISLVRQTKYVAIYTGAAVAVNVGLCVVLIPLIGGAGAAAAAALGYGVLTTLYYRKAQELYPTPYEPGKVGAILGIAAALGVLGLIRIDPVWVELTIKVGALGLFVLSLWPLGIVGSDEVRGLREGLTRRSDRQAEPVRSF